MKRAKMAAAADESTVKDMILKRVEAHLVELEKKGLLPKREVMEVCGQLPDIFR